MIEIPIVNDITALGLLAMVLILAYYTLNKVFGILVQHLDRQTKRTEEMIVLLQRCVDHNHPIKDPFSSEDDL